MKRLITTLTILIACLQAPAQNIDAIINATPKHLVNDHLHALTKDEKQKLENKLVQFDEQTSTQIAVVLIKSLNGRNLEKTSSLLFNAWGIGQKGKNNGLLVFAAMDDRKIRIEVGDGLKSVVTNSEAAAIINREILPAFRERKYYQGIDQATGSLMLLAGKIFPVTEDSASKASANSDDSGILSFFTKNVSEKTAGKRMAFVWVIIALSTFTIANYLKKKYKSNRSKGGSRSTNNY